MARNGRNDALGHLPPPIPNERTSAISMANFFNDLVRHWTRMLLGTQGDNFRIWGIFSNLSVG